MCTSEVRALIRSLAVSIILAVAVTAMADEKSDLLNSAGIKPDNGMRGQMDAVGYVTTAAQMDSVLSQSLKFSAARRKELAAHGVGDDIVFSAAVCPHDDYYYASRLYAIVTPHIRARTVILFGVFHRARAFDCRDQLVFDSFETWRGPYGAVNVSPLRDELIERLPKNDVIVNNDMQQVEHSVEAIAPWLQASNRDVQIVSIMVPYMQWDTMERLSGEVAAALAAIMKERGLSLGEDVAIVTSSDAVHYGDAGWGGSNRAEFGADKTGYEKAVARDHQLIASMLTGTVRPSSLRDFLYACVDSKDVTQYKITWCGRFSVPFGLNVASRVQGTLSGRKLSGTLLDYGTSVSETSLDLEKIPGLGTTTPNNFHHWVGYPAIGYR
jgi:AmmeMemoRadiSam system protein B